MVGISQYSILPFATASVTITLGLKVYFAKRESKLHQIFLLWCFCLSIWLFGYSVCYSIHDPSVAEVFARYSCTAVFFFSPAFHHFITEFYGLRKELKWVYLGYAIPIISIPMFFYTNFAINGIKHHFFGYYLYAGPLYIYYLAIFFLILIRTMYLIIREIKSGNLDEKKLIQSKFFMFSFFIAYCASVDFLPKYGFEYYPFGAIFIFCWVVLTAYAILKHGILDINIIKRSLIYSSFLAVLIGIFAIIVILMEKIFQNILGYKTIFGSVISAIIITIIFNPLRNKIQHLVDKYFFKATPIELAEQNELLRSEVAEKEKFKAIATLASGIAHEVKNPLSTLKTFIDYLPAKHNDPEFMEKFGRLGNQEIERVNNLVHNLLNFAKPAPPEFKEKDIKNLIQETIGLVENSARKQNINICQELKHTTSLFLDPNQIKQALLNILMNAIDAMPNGGTLTIITSLSKDKRSYQIEITDTGCGIAPEDLKQIFEPFFTKKDKGTGLGLAITYGIIQEHKGKIEVESKIGLGTKFKIKLPVVKK